MFFSIRVLLICPFAHFYAEIFYLFTVLFSSISIELHQRVNTLEVTFLDILCISFCVFSTAEVLTGFALSGQLQIYKGMSCPAGERANIKNRRCMNVTVRVQHTSCFFMWDRP